MTEEEKKQRKKESRRAYYLDHREEELSRSREYKLKHHEELLSQKRERDSNIRKKALDLYGHKCSMCGSVDGLEFHHLNLDGVEERKVYRNTKLYKYLADGNKRSDLQLLCSSCHHKIHKDLRK